jgi:nucleoid-associated protein YgaU
MYAVRSGAASIRPWRLESARLPRLRWVALALAACGLLGLAYVRAAMENRPPQQVQTVTVAPGDTLWDIASQRYPDADARLKVRQIEQLNQLDRPTIVPGQHLKVPAR